MVPLFFTDNPILDRRATAMQMQIYFQEKETLILDVEIVYVQIGRPILLSK